jgi:hypothetical protein
MGKNTHTVYRDAQSGKLITERKADSLPPSRVVREQMPNPGRGDTGRGKK